METKGFPAISTTQRALAFVYKRSFTPDIRNCKKAPCPVPLIGYARISTEDQTALPQVQELRIRGLCGNRGGTSIGRQSHAASSGACAGSAAHRRYAGRGSDRPPCPLAFSPLGNHRAAGGERCAFPVLAGSDRHGVAAGQVYPAGSGRSRRVRTGPDTRAHQGRAAICKGRRAGWRQPGAEGG